MLRLPCLALVLLLSSSLAGCATPPPADGNGAEETSGPDAPDLPVGTADPHASHGAPSASNFCGGYTLGVGNDLGVHAALHDPPPGVTVETRADPDQTWLPIDLPHPDLVVRGAWVHFAYYRTFDEEGRVEKGLSVAATAPPTLSLLGSWPVQDEPPFEVVKLLDRVVSASEEAAALLWDEWLGLQVNGTADAHVYYDASDLRLPTAWQQLFGGHPMPPRRGEGEILPAGRAIMETDGWVWRVTAPYATWTNGTVMVHGDAFGRFSVTVPEYRPRSTLEAALIDWRIPVPEQMFVSIHDGRPCT